MRKENRPTEQQRLCRIVDLFSMFVHGLSYNILILSSVMESPCWNYHRRKQEDSSLNALQMMVLMTTWFGMIFFFLDASTFFLHSPVIYL